jgi:4-carboxymuconolactone decarboxylase
MNKELFDKGDAVRREVVGSERVDASIFKLTDDFTGPMEELLTEFAWGSVWARPGLPRKTRSLINLAMLSVLNRPRELKAHLRGALRNGASREEIREVLLQVAVYCGFPAAIDAFRVAKEVLDATKGE